MRLVSIDEGRGWFHFEFGRSRTAMKVAILGHFPAMLLLLMLPQHPELFFVSIPQLFKAEAVS